MILVENMLTPITTKKERKQFEYNMDFFLLTDHLGGKEAWRRLTHFSLYQTFFLHFPYGYASQQLA